MVVYWRLDGGWGGVWVGVLGGGIRGLGWRLSVR